MVIIGLIIVGLATQIILRKGSKFPNTNIELNKYIKDSGFTYTQPFINMEQAKARKVNRFNELILGK